MPEEENDKKQGFKVNDQRRFNPDGTLKAGEDAPEPPSEAAPEPSPEPSAKPPPTEKPEAEETFSAEPESKSPQSKGSLPADLSTLILSLATSAQLGMGLAPHPESGAVHKNLDQAKHAIDLLAVIQEKTKGNLTEDEQRLLQAVLTELRMGFVEVQRSET